MVNRETSFVIGHRNPDMDSIASAIGYAWVLTQRQAGRYIPARAGELNAQTQFALQRFKLDAPQLLIDVRPRVGDIIEAIPALKGEASILQACQHYAKIKRSVPILDADGKPQDLLSAVELLDYLVKPIIDKESLSLQNALAQNAATTLDGQNVTLRDSEFLTDAIQKIRYLEADDYLVVDASDRYLGLCRAKEMLAMPRQKLVLVDHNEISQAVVGINEAEVLEILDHHRIDTIETLFPIRFQIEAVGSCSTLVFEQAQSHHLSFPAEIAGLLLCGILSDTLVFQSPTTTERDKQAAFELAGMAKLAGDLNDAIQLLGRDLLVAGAELGSRSDEEIIQSDLKFYSVQEQKLAISQIEVTSFDALEKRLPELQTALEQVLRAEKLALGLLMVTDILRNDSQIVVAGDANLISNLPFARLPNGNLNAPNMISRKKQLLPIVLASLQKS